MRSTLSKSVPHPGTPQYMSPEQIRSRNYLTPTSDIYALGLIYFELLTGRVYIIQRPGTKVSDLRKDISKEIDELITQMLSDNPNQRPWDGCELISVLKNYVEPDENNIVLLEKQIVQRKQNAIIDKIKRIRDNFSSTISHFLNDLYGESGKPIPPPPKKQLPEIPPSVEATGKSSLILRPSVRQLLSPIHQNVVQEILSQHDPERIIDFIVSLGSGSIIISGYNSFGGTTLTREIARRVRRELLRQDREEILFTVRLDLKQRTQNVSLYEGAVETPGYVKNLGLISSATEKKHSDVMAISTLFNELHNLNLGNPREIFEKKGEKKYLPSRLLIVIDKIVDMAFLDVLKNHDLFGKVEVNFLLVIDQEQYNRWVEGDNSRFINKTRMQHLYIPSLWEDEYKMVGNIINIVFKGFHLDSAEAKEMYRTFRKHIAYKGRGAIGTTLNELQDLKYWQLDRETKQGFIDFSMLDKGEIFHNAWLQDTLISCWDDILEENFPIRKSRDRAKQGVYCLLDWITECSMFTLDEIFTAAELMPVKITNHNRLREQVILRLLDMLEKKKYLQKVENKYDIIWGRGDTIHDSHEYKKYSGDETLSLKFELVERKEKLIEEYKAISKQLSTVLNQGDQIRLQRQLDEIEKEIQNLEKKADTPGII